jgi:ATP-dependent DNA helicase RecG
MTTQELHALIALGEGQLIEFKPYVAAVLLFGRHPEHFLVQSGLVVVRFAGTEPGSGPTGLPGYVRREDISGPLVQCIERGWQVVWEEMRREARITSLVREEIPEYPPFAVREAIINAMAHRDWRVSGLRNQIRIFDDRIEVVSAGGFPGHITAENIVHEQFSRNPKIVKVLYHWNYIEELGIGVDRMIRAMTEAGHPAPEFTANGHTVTVALRSSMRRMTVAMPEAWKGKLNERQMQAVHYIKEHGSITNREYREFCNVGRTVATQELSEMLQQGIVARKKSGRSTVYTLPVAISFKALNMPEIATRLTNRLKQPYSKRCIRLDDKAEKVDLLEKLRVGLMEVVRGIGTDGDSLWSI